LEVVGEEEKLESSVRILLVAVVEGDFLELEELEERFGLELIFASCDRIVK
jgi:hypothetical protein